MLRRSIALLAVLLLCAGTALAAKDKEVKAKVVKVDATKNILVVDTDGGRKVYTVSEETKFVGPKGGVSEDGLKDDRLAPGAEVTLVIAANNKTVREVRLPMRKGEGK